MGSRTLESRRRLHLQARAIVARHYGRRLTLAVLAEELASSPRELQRAYAEFGPLTFREDLQARRLRAAAELLAGQPSIAVADVARLVGYSQAPHFGRIFTERFRAAPWALPRPGPCGGRSVPDEPGGCQRAGALLSGRVGDAILGGSAPGSFSRIRVPPPGAASAATDPPC